MWMNWYTAQRFRFCWLGGYWNTKSGMKNYPHERVYICLNAPHTVKAADDAAAVLAHVFSFGTASTSLKIISSPWKNKARGSDTNLSKTRISRNKMSSIISCKCFFWLYIIIYYYYCKKTSLGHECLSDSICLYAYYHLPNIGFMWHMTWII